MLIGAAAYTPNVVPIWEGMRDYFAGTEAPMDFILFSNYGRQVDALIDDTIDIAWNTTLAWVRTVGQTDGECRALATRDTDIVFQTVMVAPAGSGLTDLESLRGRRLALGSKDSAQAAILRCTTCVRPDSARVTSTCCGSTAMSASTETPAVASSTPCVRSSTARPTPRRSGLTPWEAIGREELRPGAFEEFWTSPTYSHCNFTALPTLSDERVKPWLDALLAMDWENPVHREVLEMEGLKQWAEPQLDDYQSLFDAVKDQNISVRW